MPASTSEPASPLDTTLRIVSPENIAFDLRLAGPAPRLVAFAIDACVIIAFCTLLLLPLVLFGLIDTAVMGLFLIGSFLVWWGYGATLETINNGQTLGKRVVGLRTISQTGLSINVSQAILRNLLRAADVAPPFFPGFVAMALTRRLQRLGDLAAGTVVVRDCRRGVAVLPSAGTTLNLAGDMVPAGFVPEPALAEAFALYVARRPALSADRRQELAAIPAARLCDAWNVPPVADPDALLCAVYERTLGGGES